MSPNPTLTHDRRPPLTRHPAPLALRLSRYQRRRRRGFTLIEVLTVVGIIVLLVTIGVVGYNVLDATASKRATRAVLESAKGLLAEYELTRPVGELNSIYGTGPSPTVATPGDLNAGTDRNGNAIHDRYEFTDENGFPAVAKNQKVMKRLLAVPRNRSTLANLPEKARLKAQKATDKEPDPPVLIDGWGNPILFVPSGGMTGVTFSGVAEKQTVRSPNGRPFFASAGADGDFSTHNDNLYSFLEE